MARSLNRVQLIGNLTRDPELRYTPTGAGVCTFSLATNRSWTDDKGEKHEEADFHRIVAWSKLAELCNQYLSKGRKVYVEGRLSTRNWTAQDGSQKSTTEVVIDDMILLDNKGAQQETKETTGTKEKKDASASSAQDTDKEEVQEAPTDEVMPDDIPF
jgi:single-strand DNA-binding protein